LLLRADEKAKKEPEGEKPAPKSKREGKKEETAIKADY